jgi:hypothetical protein
MLLRFAYGKLVRKNQSTFTPGTAITTYIDEKNARIEMLGASTLATAPSTLITDIESGNIYTLNKPFSAVHAALTAVTSTNDQVNLI